MLDPFGTVVLPALLLFSGAPFLFGWAKPVPVNFGRLHHPKRDMVWVAAAGPFVNLVLATTSAAALHLLPLLPAAVSEWVLPLRVRPLRRVSVSNWSRTRRSPMIRI